jgi:CheY-like chemotaxis protein
MALVATRVLVINSQLSFAVTIKRTLEQVGGFVVSPFTTADAALDYLSAHPQDVAIVDLNLPDMPGADAVFRLRSIQPDIAILASPRSPNVEAVVHDLDLQGSIDMPITARELVPLIETAVTHMHDVLPDTAQAPPLVEESETLLIAPPEPDPIGEAVPWSPPPADVPEFSSLDSVLVSMGGFVTPSETLPIEAEDTPVEAPPEVDTAAFRQQSQPIEVRLTDTPKSGSRPVNLPEMPSEKMTLFQQLASEEPPIPTLEESGTVGDLMLGVSDADLGQVVSMMREQGKPLDYVDELKARAQMLDDESTQSIPAKVILENALDETTPPEAFSVAELITNIQAQLPPHQRDVRPLPSWFTESERYILEPDFLPESLPELDQTGGDISAQTTQPGSMTSYERHPEAMETDKWESMRRSRPTTEADALPPESLPEADEVTDTRPVTPLPQETVPLEMEKARPYDEIITEQLNMGYAPPYDDSLEQETEAMPEQEGISESMTMPAEEAAEHQADFERLGAQPIAEISEGIVKSPAAPTTSDDPYIAQLALSLTQVSLELTAEATLLAREGKIVAYSGNLPVEDIEDLRDAVANDWEANPEEARIRFITLPSSGKDYMLYSRKTDGSFTLSMIFSGTMPLRVIRRQSDRLAEALAAVPETPVEVAPVAPPIEEEESDLWPVEQAPEIPALQAPPAQIVSIGTLSPVTYLWLIADPQAALTEPVAHAILTGIDAHLSNMAWQIKTLRVHEDYLYLLVDAPADSAPQEVIHDLMRRSAEYAATADPSLNPDILWADSYLVLTPGHELDVEEVQRFINFARAG